MAAKKNKRRRKNPAVAAARHGRERRAVRAAGFSVDAPFITNATIMPNYAGPPRDYSLRKEGH